MGTTAKAFTPRAIKSSTIRSCWAALAVVGPLSEATTSGFASWNALTPTSIRLNHGMPLILTTVTMTGLPCAATSPLTPTTNAPTADAAKSNLFDFSFLLPPQSSLSELAATVLEGAAVVHGSLKSIMLSSRMSARATVRYRSSQRTSAESAQKFEKPMKLSILLSEQHRSHG